MPNKRKIERMTVYLAQYPDLVVAILVHLGMRQYLRHFRPAGK